MSGNFREDNALFIFVMWFWKGKPCDATDNSAVIIFISRNISQYFARVCFVQSLEKYQTFLRHPLLYS